MPALVAGIHAFLASANAWMAGTSPAMTDFARAAPRTKKKRSQAALNFPSASDQQLARRRRAVERTQRAARDAPALRRALELPAVGRKAMDAEALGGTVVRYGDRLALCIGCEDLQIRGDERAVAIELDVGESGEMPESALERGRVLCARHELAVLVPAPAARLVAAIEDAVVGIDRARVEIRARVRARRMARDQIVDFKTVFDIADAVFQRARAHYISSVARGGYRQQYVSSSAARTSEPGSTTAESRDGPGPGSRAFARGPE